jgi:FdhD protein
MTGYIIAPDLARAGLTRRVIGIDHTGAEVMQDVVEERPLTIYLNRQEIVTAMTIGDYPEYLALGFLRNQGMLSGAGAVTAIDYDDELGVVVVRTDMMEGLEGLRLPEAELRTSWLYALAAQINTTPSLYLGAGAIHGTVLCARDRPLVYMEDVGRHNAVDKVAGWMAQEDVLAADKIMYTTGRLTSEMVIKCAHMGIPVLASRSGFTAWGVEIAQQVGLTLIGRLRGQRFQCLAGAERIVWDADLGAVADEPRKSGRKSGRDFARSSDRKGPDQ